MDRIPMATSLPPISKEQAFLETYFQCLSKFAYDKAKELSDREKEILKTTQPATTTWIGVVNVLGNLALAEKGYTSLLFLGQNLSLGQKIFSKKDNVKNNYGTLLSDLRKIEELASQLEHNPSEVNHEQLLGHLCGQLVNFSTARLKCMEFYEQMVTLSFNRNPCYEDLLNVIGEIIQAHHKCFHHPILSPIKTSFSLECDIINQLLLAQCELQKCQFLSSLLHLHDAHTKLVSWGGVLVSKEGKKLGFGSPTKYPLPALYQWLDKFKGLLISKFSVYFYETLKHQAPPQDLKALLSKTSFDFIPKIQTFQKKSDAHNVSLVFDVSGLDEVYKGPGYHHPQKFTEPPRGLDSYPAIFSYPTEKPDRHWPSVISILTDKAYMKELDAYDKNVYFFDEKFGSTYYLSRLEPRITFVIIFESKKTERDSYINNFMNDICSLLRGTRLFAALKPGVKV